MFRIAATALLACALPALWAGPSWGFSFQGVEHVYTQSPPIATTAKTVTRACPDGKRLISTGFTIQSQAPQHVVLEAIVPNDDLTAVSVTVRARGIAAALPWALRASAMCAIVNDNHRLELVREDSAADSTDEKAHSVSCPPGKRVTGTGASVLRGAAQVALQSTHPNVALTSVTAEAGELATGYAEPWRLRTYAICARPIINTALTGLVLASASADSPFTTQDAERPCPGGRRLLGLAGGASGDGALAIGVAPEPGTTPAGSIAWAAREADAPEGNIGVIAYAICDYAPLPLVIES